MKNRRGFTLAELLGVIIIIGILALLIIPTIDNSITESKDSLYSAQINNIEKAAENWGAYNIMKLPENDNDYIIVYLWELKAGGYIDDDVRDPRNDKLFPNDMEIKITRKNHKYVYEVVEGSGTEGNTDIPTIPIITLKGESTVTVGQNDTYVDAGAMAQTFDGVDITSSIVKTSDVDTTTLGTYSVKYNVTYNGKSAKEVVRTVKVVDKNPVITLSPKETSKYEKSVTINVSATVFAGNTVSSMTYKLDGGSVQNVSNNQIVINSGGEHNIEVSVIDNEGNETTLSAGPYKIDNIPPTITFAEGDAGLTIGSSGAETFDLLTGVTVTDNNAITLDNVTVSGSLSSIADEYTITYSVSDEALNSVTKVRKITVVDCDTVILGKEMTYGEVICHDPDKNPRFVGSDPNNYVEFNGELWRIIGEFDGQAKIIRGEYDGLEMSWGEVFYNYDPANDPRPSEYSYNDWNQSILQLEFNDVNNGYIKTIETNDITSYSYIDLEHVWNIGGGSGFDSHTRANMYNLERGSTPALAEGSTVTWKGAIGLMYPSDYGYSTSGDTTICDSTVMVDWAEYSNETAYTECVENSWLYYSGYDQWTITPYSDDSGGAFVIGGTGNLVGFWTYAAFTVNPVLYLKSDVRIVDGTGDHDDPYILSQ